MDFFDSKRLDGFAGQVDLLSGRNEHAAEVLGRVLAGAFDPRQRAVSLLDLAAAWAPLDPQRAVGHACTGLDVLVANPYPPAVARIPAVRAALALTPAAGDFEDRVASAGLGV